MNTTKLFYGMKLKDKNGDIFTVEKYWKTDTDANHYKVKLGKQFEGQSYYSSDLVSLIKLGTFEIVQ